MQRIGKTLQKITSFWVVAGIGMALATGWVWFADRQDRTLECPFSEPSSGRRIPADVAAVAVVDDVVTIEIGFSGGKGHNVAQFLLPDGTLNGQTIEVVPNVFTSVNSKADRINPEIDSVLATGVARHGHVRVQVCVDSKDFPPGTYEGTLSIGGTLELNATVSYANSVALVGLLVAFMIALVATTAVDRHEFDKEVTARMYLLALASAAFGWFGFEGLVNNVGDLFKLIGAQFAAATGALAAINLVLNPGANPPANPPVDPDESEEEETQTPAPSGETSTG